MGLQLIQMIRLHRQRLQRRKLKQWCETRFRSLFHSESPPWSSSSFSSKKCNCLAFSQPLLKRGEFFVGGSSHLPLGLLRVLSSLATFEPSTCDEEALNIFFRCAFCQSSSTSTSIFAGCTCYIITFCSKHVDISVFCNLSTHFLSD